MSGTFKLALTLILTMAVALTASACGSTLKKVAVDTMVYRVKSEKPLTQNDLDAVVRMIRTKTLTTDLSTSRTIYVVGKVVTGLVQEYGQLAGLAGFDVSQWTVPDILALLDEAGLVDKKEYDYLLGVDLKIFNPLDQEKHLISENKSSLLFAVAQLERIAK